MSGDVKGISGRRHAGPGSRLPAAADCLSGVGEGVGGVSDMGAASDAAYPGPLLFIDSGSLARSLAFVADSERLIPSASHQL